MKECWSEGALRAYLDRELPASEMEQVAAHLEICSECGDQWAVLAGRAARVSELMGSLPAVDRAPRISPVPFRSSKVATWRWAGIAAALAAGLAAAFLMLPKHQQQPPEVALQPPPRVSPAPVAPVEPETPHVATALPSAEPVRARSVRSSTVKPPGKAQSADGFVALDDEPLDVGVVVRVALGPKEVPADVIFGADGRPHAIRLVENKTKQ